jgi:hypothetical protein
MVDDEEVFETRKHSWTWSFEHSSGVEITIQSAGGEFQLQCDDPDSEVAEEVIADGAGAAKELKQMLDLFEAHNLSQPPHLPLNSLPEEEEDDCNDKTFQSDVTAKLQVFSFDALGSEDSTPRRTKRLCTDEHDNAQCSAEYGSACRTSDVVTPFGDFADVPDFAGLRSPQPSPRYLDETPRAFHLGSNSGSCKHSERASSAPPIESEQLAVATSIASQGPLPGCIDDSAHPSHQKVRLLAELAVRDAQLASLRRRLGQVPGNSSANVHIDKGNQHAPVSSTPGSASRSNSAENMKGFKATPEELDCTRQVDASLIERLRCATQSQQLKGGTVCSAPSAKRRSVSYGVAPDTSSRGGKRLVAEPRTPRRQVSVPVEVIGDRRATSLPPVAAPARVAPHHFQLGAQRGKSVLVPELDWWQQLQVPEQHQMCHWGNAAFFPAQQASDGRQASIHKVWAAPQAEKMAQHAFGRQNKSNIFVSAVRGEHSRRPLRTPSPFAARPAANQRAAAWPPAACKQASRMALPGALHSGILEPVYWPVS